MSLFFYCVFGEREFFLLKKGKLMQLLWDEVLTIFLTKILCCYMIATCAYFRAMWDFVKVLKIGDFLTF